MNPPLAGIEVAVHTNAGLMKTNLKLSLSIDGGWREKEILQYFSFIHTCHKLESEWQPNSYQYNEILVN